MLSRRDSRSLVMAVVLVLALVFSALTLGAEKYPIKPIVFAIDGSPGGGSDIWSRAFLKVAEKYVGQPFVGENKPGGSSAVAFAYTMKQKPDGYTICTVTPNFIVTPLRQKLGFNYKDFEPIVALLEEGKIIFVKTGTYRNLQEVLDDGRKNPGKQKWAMYGTGTDEHIVMYLLTKAAGVKADHVPYGGSGEVVTAVLGGHVQVGVAKPSIVLGQLEAGALTAVASVTDRRLDYMPDVPTLKELGYDIDIPTWRGFIAPKGTPQDRIAFLAEAFKKTLADPEFVNVLNKLKYRPYYKAGEDLARFLDREHEKFRSLLKELGIPIFE